MAHRAAPISVSIALGHASANAVKATAGGWSTDSSGFIRSGKVRKESMFLRAVRKSHEMSGNFVET